MTTEQRILMVAMSATFIELDLFVTLGIDSWGSPQKVRSAIALLKKAYAILQGRKKPWREVVMLVDPNAKIGSIQSDAGEDRAPSEENEVGTAFHQFCIHNEIVLPATFHDWHSGQDHTWEGGTMFTTRIDYAGVPIRWKNGIVRSAIDTPFDLLAKKVDHFVPVLSTKLQGKGGSRRIQRRVGVSDKGKLSNAEVIAAFLEDVRALPALHSSVDVHKHYAIITQQMQTSLEKHFPETYRKQNNSFVADEDMNMSKMRQLFLKQAAYEVVRYKRMTNKVISRACLGFRKSEDDYRRLPKGSMCSQVLSYLELFLEEAKFKADKCFFNADVIRQCCLHRVDVSQSQIKKIVRKDKRSYLDKVVCIVCASRSFVADAGAANTGSKDGAYIDGHAVMLAPSKHEDAIPHLERAGAIVFDTFASYAVRVNCKKGKTEAMISCVVRRCIGQSPSPSMLRYNCGTCDFLNVKQRKTFGNQYPNMCRITPNTENFGIKNTSDAGVLTISNANSHDDFLAVYMLKHVRRVVHCGPQRSADHCPTENAERNFRGCFSDSRSHGVSGSHEPCHRRRYRVELSRRSW